MITATWIIVFITLIILLISIISAIVIKIDTIPNWRKVVYILYWIIGLLLFKILAWGIFIQYKDKGGIFINSSKNKTNVSSSLIDKNIYYEWYWKLPPGVYTRGRNESDEKEKNAEVVEQSEKTLGVNLYYEESGKKEVCRIRLTRNGKTLEGTWDQDNPRDHGKIIMDEVSPGVYAGEIVGEDKIVARCYLRKK